jgi:pyridinium-3,5-biscarboxylic acid mononucleotide sulfurtransferase
MERPVSPRAKEQRAKSNEQRAMSNESEAHMSAPDADPSAVDAMVKERTLRRILSEMESVIVAFSGGVDSAYLAVVAHETLGERSIAVTGESPSYPDHQRRMALEVVERFGLAHRFVATSEIESADYAANHPDRCFHCKSELYGRLSDLPERKSFRFIVDGANADDRGDFRPGRRAAKLGGVRSPLEEAELTKTEIRLLSAQRGLPTANEPASACLSSRVPYETPITIETLSMVERGEEALRRLGFRHMRVRHHDALARLEFGPEELERALAPGMRPRLVEEIKRVGYRFVAIDLEGYRTGSLNEVLPWPSRSGSRAPGTPTTARDGGSK